jgi:prepilin-type N-terminal cleavage/methylation domain-containing protein/prepilin-type processing-associated H-X9-DG protein
MRAHQASLRNTSPGTDRTPPTRAPGPEALTRRRRGAFTLIELLVVIAIIALLVSILLPSLSRAKSAAQTVQCATIIRHFAVGAELYAHENNGASPNAMRSYTKGELSSSEWVKTFYPAALFAGGYAARNDPSEQTCRELACPTYLRTKGIWHWLVNSDGTLHSYWPRWFDWNYGMVWTSGKPGESKAGDFDHLVYQIGRVKRPSRTMFLAETHITGPHEQRQLHLGDGWVREYGTTVGMLTSWYWWDVPVGPEPHDGKLNMVMFDGHVETLSYQQAREEKKYHIVQE